MDNKKLESLKKKFDFLGKELSNDIFKNPTIINFKAGTTILKSGQYITHVPVVINGLLKVFSKYEDKDLLLYYINESESCIMSFSSGMNQEPSNVYAITEEDTELLLLPVEQLGDWTKSYPRFNDFFFKEYNVRYKDLLDTINHILFDKLDKRVFNYLVNIAKIKNQNPFKITHRQIAEELGTAREVVSRILKKLETSGQIKSTDHGFFIEGL